MQQLTRQRDSAGWVTAGHRHHLRIECGDQVCDGRGVIRQWCHNVGVARIGHKAGLPLFTRAQQIDDFLSRSIQSRGGQVCGFHRVAQVQQYHQTILLLVYWLRQFLPTGAAGCHGGDDPAEKKQGQQVARISNSGVTRQVPQELWIDNRLPTATAPPHAP